MKFKRSTQAWSRVGISLGLVLIAAGLLDLSYAYSQVVSGISTGLNFTLIGVGGALVGAGAVAAWRL